MRLEAIFGSSTNFVQWVLLFSSVFLYMKLLKGKFMFQFLDYFVHASLYKQMY